MPDRITLSRAKGWRMPENTVKASRPSLYGNPWQAPAYLHVANARYLVPGTMTVGETIEQHRHWLVVGAIGIDAMRFPDNLTPFGRVALKDELAVLRAKVLANLPHLRGKNLACWCKPGQPCHADVLLEIANA
jgi:hypothetical protein